MCFSFKKMTLQLVSGSYTIIRCHTDRYCSSTLRNSSQDLIAYFEGRENLNLNLKFQIYQNKSLSLVNKTRCSLSTIGNMMIW